MAAWLLPSGCAAPKEVAAEIDRRLAGLARPDIRIVADTPAATPASAYTWKAQWTRYERAAAAHYEAQGYEVVRLSHETVSSVGEDHEARVPGASQVAAALSRLLPEEDLRLLTARTRAVRKALVLNGVDPRRYSLSFYPPDFLCSLRDRPGEWFFVEVKGPRDSLHIRQANWLVHLKPSHWRYEVCMPMKGVPDGTLLRHSGGTAAGPAFRDAFAAELSAKASFKAMLARRPKLGR